MKTVHLLHAQWVQEKQKKTRKSFWSFSRTRRERRVWVTHAYKVISKHLVQKHLSEKPLIAEILSFSQINNQHYILI